MFYFSLLILIIHIFFQLFSVCITGAIYLSAIATFPIFKHFL